jgi:hypothetical protein
MRDEFYSISVSDNEECKNNLPVRKLGTSNLSYVMREGLYLPDVI